LKGLFHLKSSALRWEGTLRKNIHNQPGVQLPFIMALPIFVAIAVILGSIFIFQAPGYWGLMGIGLPENTQLDELLLFIDKPNMTKSTSTSTVISPREIVLPVSFQTHRIGTGESLSAVANRFQIQVGTLISWNQIANARRLPVGLELEIPSYDGIRYVVKRGDSLTSIAQEKRVSYNAILDANNLESPVLAPGQVLFLPGASLSRNELRMAMGELFIFPARGRLTSRFGWRRDPFTGVRSFHNGIDIANDVGTPVWAAKEGIVADVGYHSAFGNYVVINHDNGYQTLYGHLHSYSVRKGQSVNQGQVIARMGNTGYSTGSHLHFTVLLRNKEIDPMRILY
jgi:murein DD-endopeptidase MepM/ murein hydrolase activator NlpD